MAKKETEEQEHQTPEWLKTIQLNSWEAELLVSALVLYALFQVPGFLEVYIQQQIDQGSLFHGFSRLVIEAIHLLRIGYILHILVRGLWVASVGLSYVFPNGIIKESLRFKGKFNRELESNRSLVNSVLRLEELSSTIYGITFLLFGSLLGFATMLFSIVFFVEQLAPFLQENKWFAPIYVMVPLLYILSAILLLIDFITGGFLRRKKWAVEWFYPIAAIFRVLTLSFLYRRSLLVLISNVKGWKSRLIPIVLLGVIVIFDRFEKRMQDHQRKKHLIENQESSAISANFENLRDPDDHLLISLQSDIVSSNTLKIFLKDLGLFNGFYMTSPVKGLKWYDMKSSVKSNYLQDWLTIKIDSVLIKDPKWFKIQHTSTYDHGFTAYIDLKSIERGLHNISFAIDTMLMDERKMKVFRNNQYYYDYLSNINFFYDKQ